MRPSGQSEFLGVDVGEKRVGIARGSMLARLAEPLKTVSAAVALAELENLVSQHHSAGIVVGLPRGLDGQETAQTKAIRNWVTVAKSKLNLPFYWQDEALTSVAGQPAVTDKGLDAAAAAIILQDFLDTPVDQRVRC